MSWYFYDDAFFIYLLSAYFGNEMDNAVHWSGPCGFKNKSQNVILKKSMSCMYKMLLGGNLWRRFFKKPNLNCNLTSLSQWGPWYFYYCLWRCFYLFTICLFLLSSKFFDYVISCLYFGILNFMNKLRIAYFIMNHRKL